MTNVARRGFLGLVAAAPVALPVAAKEAAAKMGLSGLASAGHLMGYAGESASQVPQYDHLKWLKERLAQYADPEHLANMRRNARRHVARLDPDIASMRGISPSAAFSIQVERDVAREIEEQTWSLRKQIKEATGF